MWKEVCLRARHWLIFTLLKNIVCSEQSGLRFDMCFPLGSAQRSLCELYRLGLVLITIDCLISTVWISTNNPNSEVWHYPVPLYSYSQLWKESTLGTCSSWSFTISRDSESCEIHLQSWVKSLICGCLGWWMDMSSWSDKQNMLKPLKSSDS